MLNVTDIQNILPHRYPFLLVDRITEVEPLKKAIGVKNVTINEQFFQGHFPGKPVMPGVLIVEAMAQVGALALLAAEENSGKIVLLASVDYARFHRPVIPGDQLILEAEIIKLRGTIGKLQTKAFVAGKKVAEAEMVFALTANE